MYKAHIVLKKVVTHATNVRHMRCEFQGTLCTRHMVNSKNEASYRSLGLFRFHMGFSEEEEKRRRLGRFEAKLITLRNKSYLFS